MLQEKALELGRMIGQSPEYQALKRANEALKADRAVTGVLTEVERLRRDVQRMMEKGEQPSDEMERKLTELISGFETMPVSQRLIAAQENFDKLMMKVNDTIIEGIEKGATSSIITLG